VAKHYPEAMRIVLTGRPTVENLIRAINEGAVYQFFTKPCDAVHLGIAIRKALEHKILLTENRRLLDMNGDRAQELERCRRSIGTLTAAVSRDVQKPLQTAADCCRALGEHYRAAFDPKSKSLADGALTAIAEAQRILYDLGGE
jgi:DNA-binding NtrC family response regulator